MHQAVDRRRGGHRVFEDRRPLRERQVAGQHHAAALVAFRQEREEHLHLLAAPLHVAEVVDDRGLEARQFLQEPFELEIPLGGEQFLHQQAARREEHRVSPQHELLGHRTNGVRFS